MLQVGLNPYGLTYWLGLQGAGSPRANPNGVGLEGFLGLAQEIGAKVVELHNGWLGKMSEAELVALRERLAKLGMVPVVSSGLVHEPVGSAIGPARVLGAKTIRLALTRVLEGNRNGLGDEWPKLVETVRSGLKEYAAKAAEHGIWLGIEDHQDFTSQELVDFCDEAGPNVGITFDMANPFSVGESPLDFTRRIAPKVRHMHLKDYNVQFTDEGIRLVRSAIGDGAVPFSEMIEIIQPHQRQPDGDDRACCAGGAPHPLLPAGVVERLCAHHRRRARRLSRRGPSQPPAGRRRLPHALGEGRGRSGAHRLRIGTAPPQRGEPEETRDHVGKETGMAGELSGKVAFVSGSGRGLGRRVAEKLAELGRRPCDSRSRLGRAGEVRRSREPGRCGQAAGGCARREGRCRHRQYQRSQPPWRR